MTPRKILLLTAFVQFLLLVAGPVEAQIGAGAEHDQRVEHHLQAAKLTFDIDSDGDFRLVSRFDDGRTQLVFINSNTERYGHMEIREIWSVGFIPERELSAEIMRKLLQKNDELKLGSWKIMEMGGREHAVFYAQIAANADRQTLMRTLQLVSEVADELEKITVGTDDL